MLERDFNTEPQTMSYKVTTPKYLQIHQSDFFITIVVRNGLSFITVLF